MNTATEIGRRQEQLALDLRRALELLREYLEEFPAFRDRPEGSPWSEARAEQIKDIAREDAARVLIQRYAE